MELDCWMSKIVKRWAELISWLVFLVLLMPGIVWSKPLSVVFERERSVDEDIIYFSNGDVLRGDILDRSFDINSTYCRF